MAAWTHAAGMIALLAAAGSGCSFDPSGIAPTDQSIDAAVSDPADAEVDDSPDAEPAPTAFEKIITIHGAKITGDLDDFPVYIELVDQDLQARASPTGADMYFVDAATEDPLDHEIQRWDPQDGRLEAWVRIPVLEQGVDREIALRYGDVEAAPAVDPAGVWSNGFVAVWHLEQSPAGGTDAILDSAGDQPGTGSPSMALDNLVAATLGHGLEFDGDDDEVTFANPLTGPSPHTISAWVDQEETDDNDALVVLGNGACGQARWFHTRFTGDAVAAGFYCDDATGGPNIQDEGPILLHWTYDADDQTRIYADAQLTLGPLQHAGTQVTVGGMGRIGNAPGAFGQDMGLNAVVDEVRIANVARSSDWIATEHANQSDPSAFYSVGDERPLPSP